MHNVSIIVVIGFRDETKKVGEYPTRTYMTAMDLYGSDDSLSDYDLNVTLELNQDLSNAELGNPLIILIETTLVKLCVCIVLS